jgi:hypothetical protein
VRRTWTGHARFPRALHVFLLHNYIYSTLPYHHSGLNSLVLRHEQQHFSTYPTPLPPPWSTPSPRSSSSPRPFPPSWPQSRATLVGMWYVTWESEGAMERTRADSARIKWRTRPSSSLVVSAPPRRGWGWQSVHTAAHEPHYSLADFVDGEPLSLAEVKDILLSSRQAPGAPPPPDNKCVSKCSETTRCSWNIC